MLQPTAQFGQTDGADWRSHLRVYCLLNGRSVKTPVGQTSTRLPANSLSSVPSPVRPKYILPREPKASRSVPPA